MVAGDSYHQLQSGDHKNILSKMALGKEGGVLPRPECAYPPLVAVVGGARISLELKGSGVLHPTLRDDLLPLPDAALEEKLAEFRHVLKAHGKAVAPVTVALGVCATGDAVHVQGIKKHLFSVFQKAFSASSTMTPSR